MHSPFITSPGSQPAQAAVPPRDQMVMPPRKNNGPPPSHIKEKGRAVRSTKVSSVARLSAEMANEVRQLLSRIMVPLIYIASSAPCG